MVLRCRTIERRTIDLKKYGGATRFIRVATCPGSPGSPGNVLEFNFVLEIVLEIIKMDKCPGNQKLKKYFVLEIPKLF